MSSRPLSLYGHKLSCKAHLAGKGAGMGALDRTLKSGMQIQGGEVLTSGRP